MRYITQLQTAHTVEGPLYYSIRVAVLIGNVKMRPKAANGRRRASITNRDNGRLDRQIHCLKVKVS